VYVCKYMYDYVTPDLPTSVYSGMYVCMYSGMYVCMCMSM
jgi:hypothetical protein